MDNFKGGFAFNNEAAKVEVEQAPDGTLISCVNPVTGESLGGGGGDASVANVTFKNVNTSLSPTVTLATTFYSSTVGDASSGSFRLPANTEKSVKVLLYKGQAVFQMTNSFEVTSYTGEYDATAALIKGDCVLTVNKGV